MLDADTNSLSDVWEAAFNAVGVDPSADPDGDGLSSFEESIAGTDPFDSGSVLAIRSVEPFNRACLLRWNSVAGKRYQVDTTDSLADPVWTPEGPPVDGTGSDVLAVIPLSSAPVLAARIRLITDNAAVVNGRPYLEHLDTDLDGTPDIDEWAAGTNPFDASSRMRITGFSLGSAARLSWPTVRGKQYQVQIVETPAGGAWSTATGTIEGTGSPLTAAVEVSGAPRFFRIMVADSDSDLDGLTDWEEQLANLPLEPPIYRTNHPTDPASISSILGGSNIIEVAAGVAVANLTRQSAGSFLLTRRGNLNRVIVHYAVGGDAVAGQDYEALSGTVALDPGVNSVEIPVLPLPVSGLTPSKGVVVTLLGDQNYVLGSNAVARVNVIREVELSVADFGAVGDGITDDTLAIQAAIRALELSADHNTLRFPAGVYRLNTPRWKPNLAVAWEGWYELLRVGETTLAGRDLLFVADTNATLYASVPGVDGVRVQMLVANTSFRSLTFRGLTWRKTSTPLPTRGGGEGASGVVLERHDLSRVESVDFVDCTFDNCHAAVDTSYLGGYDTRGKLAYMRMHRCNVVNPYGANTTPEASYSGGGQQLRISPWVGCAIYGDCHFDGGAERAMDPSTNPGLKRKDGCHFGSPLRLVFTNNVVRNMNIEAVHQIDDPYMGTTLIPFTIPPADGLTSVEASLRPYPPSSFKPGQILNFRTWFVGSPGSPGASAPINVFLRVVSFDSNAWKLTLINEGLTPNVEGLSIPSWQSMYLQDYNPTIAEISGNIIETDLTTGYLLTAVASNSKATISDNFLRGYENGVLLYNNVRNPLNPPTPGTVVTRNVILTRNPAVSPYANYGVSSWGPGEFISDNFITSPESTRFRGVALRFWGESWVEGNTVVPLQVVHYAYSNPDRSLGVTFNINAKWCTAVGNRTYGLDVGVGPEVPGQSVPHWVISHLSYDDTLAVDPIGLLP